MIKQELIITPKTKVFDIITAYPQLEDILIAYVPTFEKLKNPVLRRTVGKIATLQQAAQIGNVSVVELVNHLRSVIGQTSAEIQAEDDQYNYTKPSWFDPEKLVYEFDVSEMLANGEHPVAQVIEDLKKLGENKIYKLVAPFLPIPLIDKASGLEFVHWIHQVNDELFYIYFVKLGK